MKTKKRKNTKQEVSSNKTCCGKPSCCVACGKGLSQSLCKGLSH